MLGKSLLPHFGGSAATWAVCLLFFQTALLLGYLYAYGLTQLTTVKWQISIHLPLLAGGSWFARSEFQSFSHTYFTTPSLQILAHLSQLALPFVLLAAHSTLLQSWLSRRQNIESSPFRMFAASNLGCIAALWLYVFLIEPQLSFSSQSTIWTYCYLFVIAAVALSAGFTWKAGTPPATLRKPPSISSSLKKIWVVETAIPAALLVSLTSYLSFFVPASPLVWVLTLTLYLASIIIPFGFPRLRSPRFLERTWPVLVVMAIATYILHDRIPLALALTLHSSAFFLVCWGLHAQVVRKLPAPASLPEFYLYFSLGGFLGALVASLVAPAVLNSCWEYPLLLAAARLVFRPTARGESKKHGKSVSGQEALWFAGFYALLYSAFNAEILPPVVLLAVGLLLALTFRRPARIAVAGLCALQVFLMFRYDNGLLLKTRSFYTALEVRRSNDGAFHELLHGSTVHGRQSTKTGSQDLPLSYYSPTSGVGHILKSGKAKRIGAVGLGVGAIAGYVSKGQSLDFYEIDAAVIDIAENPKYFSFVQRARQRGAQITHHLGDARTQLSQSNLRFDVIVIDAFHSTAIPMHLLTTEALQVYLHRLSKHGQLLFHIPSKNFAFTSLLQALADHHQLRAYEHVDPATEFPGSDPSRWVLLSRHSNVAATPASSGWRRLRAPQKVVVAWTDQKSSLLSIW